MATESRTVVWPVRNPPEPGSHEEFSCAGGACSWGHLGQTRRNVRPTILERYTNETLPLDPGLISGRVARILADRRPSGQVPPLWDGRAARRIVDALEERLGS